MRRYYLTTFLLILATQVFTEQLEVQDSQIVDARRPEKSDAYPIKEKSSHFTEVQPTIEAKAGYFFFASSRMRDVYTQGGLDLQLSTSYPVWRGLEIYGSVEYLQRSGRSLSNHWKTTIWEIPVSLGLKPVIEICPEAQWYFTLGPRYFYIHQHNYTSYVTMHKGKSGVGLFVNSGFNFIAWKHLLIDVFGEYSYQKVHFHTSRKGVHTRDLQVGGFSFGGGLGYAF